MSRERYADNVPSSINFFNGLVIQITIYRINAMNMNLSQSCPCKHGDAASVTQCTMWPRTVSAAGCEQSENMNATLIMMRVVTLVTVVTS